MVTSDLLDLVDLLCGGGGRFINPGVALVVMPLFLVSSQKSIFERSRRRHTFKLRLLSEQMPDVFVQ